MVDVNALALSARHQLCGLSSTYKKHADEPEDGSDEGESFGSFPLVASTTAREASPMEDTAAILVM